MAPFSATLFFLLLPFSIHAYQKCPKYISYHCPDFHGDSVEYPFTNHSLPDCGFCMLECKNHNNTTIQCGQQQLTYKTKQILPHNNTIVLLYPGLHELTSKVCKVHQNDSIIIPTPPFTTLKILNLMVFFRCPTGNGNRDVLTNHSTNCGHDMVYGPYPEDEIPKGILSDCTTIELPNSTDDSFTIRYPLGDDMSKCLDHTTGKFRCNREISDNLRFHEGQLSIGLGLVLLVIGCYGLYRFVKRRREIKRRAKFFKRNGGLLLQQQLSSNEGVVERTKIFTTNELEKATDNFNENRILGQGGQGTVYKGMLSDGRTVAIKKSKLLDESQLEQFINEVGILSQINHRHVVKLLGCCLETEVPLLVYEFISNGTLFEHIHDPSEDLSLSWKMRLKIAADSAGAIAYLHSSSSIPIYHRDIKSSNILLDDENRVKVSDFGSSKTIAIDQTHLTTLVQGTMGYLDPEYFQSYQFTDKSDVYSFGVVLLELLTGMKPIYRVENMEQKSLVTEFLFLMENSKLYDILDHEVMKEASEEELIAVADLARCCLSWKGKMRPTMKEVTMALEMIIKSTADMSIRDQQTDFGEGLSEIFMPSTSEAEFMSSPPPSRDASSVYMNVQPLLRDTM